MSSTRDVDGLVRQFLAVGTDELPREAYDDLRWVVDRTRQRPVIARWSPGFVPRPAWLAGVAVVLVAVAIGASLLPMTLGPAAIVAGSDLAIPSVWPQSADVAFTAVMPSDAPTGLYWRAATYDTYALTGWTQSDATSRGVAAGQPLVAGSGELRTGSRERSATITPVHFGGMLVAPGVPVAVDRATDVVTTGSGDWLDQVRLVDGGPYRVTASVPDGTNPAVVTGSGLEAASTDYPADIESRYTAVPAGALGPHAMELLQTAIDRAGTHNPYRLAQAIDQLLGDPSEFTYATDLRSVGCTSGSVVECFAQTRMGYCLQYASTMAMLLRAANPDDPIPTRLVQGFLPGTRSAGVETVLDRQAHAWVEVYFPGYGWIPFDPTAFVSQLPVVVGVPGTAVPSQP